MRATSHIPALTGGTIGDRNKKKNVQGGAQLGIPVQRRFAFIKSGEFSHVNSRVLEQLTAHFPNLVPEVIDLGDLARLRVIDLPGLFLEVAREFGLSECLSPPRLRRHAARTRLLYDRTRESLRLRLGQHNYAFTFQTQSLFDASRPGVPHFIYTDHTHLQNLRYPEVEAATPFSIAWTRLERIIYERASLIFTMSANITRSLVEDYGCSPDKVACVYAGGNVSAGRPEDLNNEERFKTRHILFVGLDWERKGGPVLLEAFRSVRLSMPDARLSIVGCAPRIQEPGVRVFGRVPLSDVPDFYRSASVFCFPTLNEPFGLVLLEAFSYGLPVVATRLGAIPEIVTDGRSGFLVTPRNVGELADRLLKLLADPTLSASFGAAGRAHVLQRYSWEGTGAEIAAHISRVAAM